MSYDRGNVRWGPAPQKNSPSYRPWLIVNSDIHPFSHIECIGLGLTTQQHSEGIEVTESDWIQGGSRKSSYISPWYVATLKHHDLDRHQGTLAESVVESAVNDLHEYTSPP